MLMSAGGTPDDLDHYVGDPGVARSIRSWARDQGVLAMTPAVPWRQRGGSGALLLKLHIIPVSTPRMITEAPVDVLLKVCSAGSSAKEPMRHWRAWQGSPDFASRHLFRQAYPPEMAADGRVLMFLDSSDSLADTVTLGQVPMALQSDACGATIRLLLDEWNPPEARQRYVIPVREFLANELRGVLDRGRSAYGWAASVGLIPEPTTEMGGTGRDGGLPDIARHFRLESKLADAVEFMAGRSHGDLHVDNVIVPRTQTGGYDFNNIKFIDLSGFDAMAPLSRDVASLLTSLVLAVARSGPSPVQTAALFGLLTSATPSLGGKPNDLERAILAARRSALMQIDARFHQTFHRQFLLSLIGQAIIYTSYDNVGSGGRHWYFALGAAAADAYRQVSQ